MLTAQHSIRVDAVGTPAVIKQAFMLLANDAAIHPADLH
jgi:hypothetical protein